MATITDVHAEMVRIRKMLRKFFKLWYAGRIGDGVVIEDED